MVRIIAHNLSQEVSQNPRICAAIEICRTLRADGFEAWWVGGCVRDFVLDAQRIPTDIDITTNAAFSTIQDVFPGIIAIGKAFGVGLLKHRGFNFEIATFRKESDYSDRRHPSQVGPGTMEEDSQRRDFTINALYFDPLSHKIADFHGGLEDAQRNVIRCVGNARERLYEDPLRIFRLFRFAANLGLSIETSTMDAAQELVSELKFVSKERFLLEIAKLKPHALSRFTQLAQRSLEELTGIPLPLSAGYPSDVKLPLDAFRFSGTLLVLMCLWLGASSEVDWAEHLSDWPLTLEDKSHIEFIRRLTQGQFVLPEQHQTCTEFSNEMRWLSKQNRIRVCDSDWIFHAIPYRNRQKSLFLTLLIQLLRQNDPKTPIGQAFTQVVSVRAKPLHKELQLWAKDKSPEALGWARLVTEVIILLDLCGLPTEGRPQAFQHAERGRLKSV
ncbi:MAG: hypothetical protein RJB13_115, partial [Pseudomonadota bacterium]